MSDFVKLLKAEVQQNTDAKRRIMLRLKTTLEQKFSLFLELEVNPDQYTQYKCLLQGTINFHIHIFNKEVQTFNVYVHSENPKLEEYIVTFLEEAPELIDEKQLCDDYFLPNANKIGILNQLKVISSAYNNNDVNENIIAVYANAINDDDPEVRAIVVRSFDSSSYCPIGIELLVQRLRIEKDNDVLQYISGSIKNLLQYHLIDISHMFDVHKLIHTIDQPFIEQLNVSTVTIHDIVCQIALNAVYHDHDYSYDPWDMDDQHNKYRYCSDGIELLVQYTHVVSMNWELLIDCLMQLEKNKIRKDHLYMNLCFELIESEAQSLSDEYRSNVNYLRTKFDIQ